MLEGATRRRAAAPASSEAASAGVLQLWLRKKKRSQASTWGAPGIGLYSTLSGRGLSDHLVCRILGWEGLGKNS